MSKYNNRHFVKETFTNPICAVDKVQLVTPDFHISPDAKLTIVQSNYTLNDGVSECSNIPLFKTGGRYIYGQRAYRNSDRCNVSISVIRDRPYLQVTFNPNKLYHPYEPTPSFDMMIENIRTVQAQLGDDGIHSYLGTARITRLDAMKQKQLDDPLTAHHNIFGLFKAKRQFVRTYEDTYVIGNKQHQTIAYDKGIEQQLDIKNLVRVEVRALKSKSVEGIYGYRQLDDLYNSNTPHLTAKYNHHLTSKVFVSSEPQGELFVTKEIDLLSHYITTGKNGVAVYLRQKGIEHILTTFGSIEAFVKVLVNCGMSRMTANNWYNTLTREHTYYLSIVSDRLSNNSRLYNNIYSFAS